MKLSGIPTNYKSRRYRSRIEARWAKMFDLLDWQYEYEPYDLNGWIPDFILLGASEILVEVKFHTILSEFDINKCLEAMCGTEKENKEILLLGCIIPIDEDFYDGVPCVGWLDEVIEDGVTGCIVKSGFRSGIALAPFNHYNNKWGFIHSCNSYADRMTGLYDGTHYLDFPRRDEIYELWQEAGNQVQWKKND